MSILNAFFHRFFYMMVILLFNTGKLLISCANDKTVLYKNDYRIEKVKATETPSFLPTIEPSQSPLPSLVDCSESCLFPDTYSVTPKNAILYIRLPRTFTMKFEYQVLNQQPYDPSYKRIANIFDIYSITNKKSLLSVSFESNTNQVCVFYNGVKVLFFGPTVHYSFNTYSKFTMTVSDTQIVINNGGFNQFGNIPKALLSDQNILYTSSNIFDGTHYSAGGTIRKIYFEGINIYLIVVIIDYNLI